MTFLVNDPQFQILHNTSESPEQQLNSHIFSLNGINLQMTVSECRQLLPSILACLTAFLLQCHFKFSFSFIPFTATQKQALEKHEENLISQTV